MKKLLFLLCLILFYSNLFAQFGFNFPLKSGNTWVYNYYDRISGEVLGGYKILVSDSISLENGFTYFKINDPAFDTGYFSFVRKANDGNYYSYGNGGVEFLEFKPTPVSGEKWQWDSQMGPEFDIDVKVTDIFYSEVFGNLSKLIEMRYDYDLISFINLYSEKYGLLKKSMSESTESSSLKGCVLDGVVYGDTTRTIVGVKQETQKPKQVILGQNYPNPFNPSTTIPFRLIQAGSVKLSVFDVSGKEIRVLTQGFRSAGDHRVTFSGDDLPSGLYLVRLETQNQTFTKKMMLVK
ncbi:MAG: T9SS type A sorting domain-containing protein [Bacteroidetes bacterium]|nr:T9SS type A sorting domain-containing protein [Bacteroidota bacterium]